MARFDRNGNLRNDTDFPEKLREWAISYLKDWTYSEDFLKRVELEFKLRAAKAR